MNKSKRSFLIFSVSFLASTAISIAGAYLISLTLENPNPFDLLSKAFDFLISLKWVWVSIALLVVIRFLLSPMTLSHELPAEEITGRILILLVGVLCIVWTFPSLVIYWIIAPHNYKRAIEIAVFFSSTGSAFLYYYKNSVKFPSVADKVTFFSGVCLGPVAAVQILF